MQKRDVAELRKKKQEQKKLLAAAMHQEVLDSLKKIHDALELTNKFSAETTVSLLDELKGISAFGAEFKNLAKVLAKQPKDKAFDPTDLIVTLDSIKDLILENQPKKRAKDYIPYRRVIKVGEAYLFDDVRTPTGFGGGGGGGSSNGLTNAQLRASPVPVAVQGDVTITGDVIVDQVGIENTAGDKINPATEEKQDEQIGELASIGTNTGNTVFELQQISNQLPGLIGQTVMAGSVSVVIASDQIIPISSVDIGEQADTVASTDTGTFSLIALVKRIAQWLTTIAGYNQSLAGTVDGTELQVDVVTQPGIVGTVADDATNPGNPVMTGGVAKETDGTDPGQVSAEDDAIRFIGDRQRVQLVNVTPPRHWSVSADYGSAQTNTSVKAAPGSGLKLYITDIAISNGATAGNITLLDGSGGTVLYEIYTAINGGAVDNRRTPIVLTADTALCITSSTVTTHSVNISGYIAP